MNYTALDFETANPTRASICAIGLVRVENGKAVARVSQLIRPDSPFHYSCTCVHGIDAFDVRTSPRFPDFWDNIKDFFKDTVVAHNAAFDISCLRESLKFYGLEFPEFDYLCTLCISRKVEKLPSHSLDALARHYGLESFKHHDALEDARTCARIFNILSERIDVEGFKKHFLDEPAKSARCRPSPFGRPTRGVFSGELPKAQQRPPRPAAENSPWKSVDFPKAAINPPQSELFGFDAPQKSSEESRTAEESQNAEPLFISAAQIKKSASPSPQADLIFDYSPIDFAKNFVITGRFSSVSRQDAEGLILYRGGKVQRSVTAETDYVIVGSKRSLNWKFGEYGEKIDTALNIGRAVFIAEEHFLKEI